MDSRKVLATAETLRRFLGNARAVSVKAEFIAPLVAVYHVTYDCNARCAWCSTRQHQRADSGEVSWSRIEQIFRSLHELTPALYLSGGEPLLDPRIEDMIVLARDLGFYPIAVNTNATLLDQRSRVPELADLTVVSLHSVDPKLLAKVYGFAENVITSTLANILRSYEIAKAYGNRMVANCVLTPENVRQADDVLRFCLESGISFSVTSAILDHEPVMWRSEVEERAAFNAFLDRVITAKRHDWRSVWSSLSYLQRLRMLEGFDCRPTSIVSVTPDGQVLNPCLHKYPELPKHLGLIQNGESLSALLANRLDGRRGFTSCGHKCLKACYAEAALALERPWYAILERLVAPLYT